MGGEERGGLAWDRQLTIDLPRIDFGLLIENICDPDHGVFAHQASRPPSPPGGLCAPLMAGVSLEADTSLGLCGAS